MVKKSEMGIPNNAVYKILNTVFLSTVVNL